MFHSASVSQPALFDFSDSAIGIAELFPAVWHALEELNSPDVDTRYEALDRLLEMKAHQISPLVAYVLATRIEERDIGLRFRVVQALGELISPGDSSEASSESVRAYLKAYLSQMRRRKIHALLQVADFHRGAESNVAALLNACSYAGDTLADIFSDRKMSIEIRRQAINFVGRVGFLDAVPALERLADRLEARMNGQRKMPFAPPSDSDEKTLLPAVQGALRILQSP